uniref:Alpha/beta hydrolase n=1 Tax=Schlesneria paludicola TaxID=360056 RepID=A0A7C2NVY8_9PLAN
MRLPWLGVVVCCAAVWCQGAQRSHAADEKVLLWPQGAPGKQGDEDVDKAWLWVYPAAREKANGTAIVVCPGGGYGALAVDHEGTQIARWLNSIGVSAYVLKYRLGPRYRHPAPMQDVQRALQYVRSNAAANGIAPNRIGVMGFSAGGHLASTAATHVLDADPNAADPVAKVSSRPDFAVLAYPVISMTEPWGHAGSKRNLLGENPDPDLAKLMSNEQQVSPQTPPTFLFHTAEDTGVPVENSLAFFAACRKHKVPAELHVYQFGPHGVGLAPGDPALSTWKERLHDWLRNSGFLADVQRAEVSGKITVAGEPVKWGQVRFTPASVHAPIAFAMVRNGAFKVDAAHGPVVGQNTVEVVTMGDIVPHPTVSDAAVKKSPTLRVEITAGTQTLELTLP